MLEASARLCAHQIPASGIAVFGGCCLQGAEILAAHEPNKHQRQRPRVAGKMVHHAASLSRRERLNGFGERPAIMPT